jgi:acetoin utilization deacetylase AcuC-like enzyme
LHAIRRAQPDTSEWHPEKPKRLWASWDRLRDKGIVDRCQRVVAREAVEDELLGVHTKEVTRHAARALLSSSTHTRMRVRTRD